MRWPVPLVILLGCLPTMMGCGGCDTSGQAPIEYRGGTTYDAGTRYRSAAIGDEYLHFPPGRRFDLMHELITPPGDFSAQVSFQPSLARPNGDNEGNISTAAGNQVVVECADEERIRIRNDTCAEMYVRLTAVASSEQSDEGAACD